MNLNELTDQILACTQCPLRQTATAPVPGVGEIGAKYLLIGEAPGGEEDKAGCPFVGLSGKRLDKLLALAGIDKNDCYFTNVVKCRPPRNKDPKKGELKLCSKWLLKEIELVKPQYIITLGRIPLSLFCPYGIKVMHGTMFEYEFKEIEGEEDVPKTR